MTDPRPILLVILLTLLAGTSVSLWRKSNELDSVKQTVAVERAAALAERARIVRAQTRTNEATVQGWAAAVDYWRSHGGAVVRVRPAACPAGAVPALPRVADGVAGLPAREPRSGAALDVAAVKSIDAGECEARLNGSVMDAVWIAHVKSWIKKQHEERP